MKIYRYISVLFIPIMALSMALFTSCDDDSSSNGVDGAPEVFYVRIPDPAASDSLLAGAALGTNIVIVGNNLGGTEAIWFNDQEGEINPSWVTNSTIHVNVPSAAPAVVSNKFYLINNRSDTAAFDFVVEIAAPRLDNVKNEWPLPGEDLVINGDFFFAPATVTFAGGVIGEVQSVEQNQMVVSVPEGATEGPISIETNFGTGISTFHIWDSRNIFLDFTNSVGNGWRSGLVENADGPVDAEYLVIRGNIDANQRNEGDGGPSPLLMQHWGIGGSRPEGNFYPGYYADYVLKFEAKVNSWYGGYLNICLANWNYQNGNQEIWGNDQNARAIWGPWDVDNAEYKTDGWVTVVIPMTEFRYSMGSNDDGVFYEDLAFNEANAGSIATWILGSPESDGSLVEFYIDNMRIVLP
ncbi:MAG: hypothetical protein JXR07_19640 [Reichenbachiella sp.]